MKGSTLGWLSAALMALGCLVALFAVQQTWAQHKGKTRPMLTRHWMAGVQGPNCSNLAKLLKDKGPADEKEWAQAEQSAALLNEASYILMEDGRCPSAAWANACKTLGDCSAALLKAIEAKNVADAQSAFKGLTKACTTCHEAHRKKD